MDQAISLLKNIGITPDKVTPEAIEKIKDLKLDFNNPDGFTGDNCKSILDILGIDLKMPEKKEQKLKIRRNDPCPCNSGKKHKKCCGSNN